uniref:Interferon gamma receptor 1 n=1 Tax=Sander lucioperca TaxID=283035 RepID=A0A8D0D3I4_SANLU
DYSEHGPQTRFIVQIEGSEGKPYQNETTDHRYNLSDYIWASEKRYMDLHYVTVTAVEGGNQSEPVTSETLSFNDLKTVKIKCELDFPPVDVYEKDSGATVSFRNPLHYYSQLKHAVKTDATIFKFSSDYGDVDGVCTVKQKNCKHDISFPEGAEKCVNLTGSLFKEDRSSYVLFRKTHICATPSTPSAAFAIMLFLLFVVISVVIFLICKAKAWTMNQIGEKNNNQPTNLIINFEAARNHWDGEYDPVSSTDYSLLTVIPAKPCKNLSVSSEDGDSLSKDRDSLTEDSCCSSSGGELGDGYRGDEDFAEDSVKTETLSIDVEGMEENERSPYDCPHNLPRNLQVDMGDGDMVTGYSERERG